MKKKFESLKILKSEILDSKLKSKELAKKLSKLNPENINSTTSEENLILIGYFLSGIYSSIEEIFIKVAKQFENKIEDPTRWHLDLLNRMALEIEEIRPALISKKSREYLDELRKFRHVFRFSYTFEFDWEKMLIVVKRWQEGRELIYRDIDKFLLQLDQLAI
ncbi:MAG: hypothetical protein ACE5HI_03410 [bacterium]